MVAVLLLFLQSAGDPTPVYDGRLHRIEVRVPRIDAPSVHIDGVLDEAAWQQAALLTGFTQYRPVDSRPAEDSTEVLAFYGPDAIYFGIRAYEAHGNVVRATLADRDNIDADDKIQILLDTFNDRRRALLFAVNPLGVQQDGVRSEGLAGAAGGQNAGFRFDGVVDLNPDYVYESKGRVTPWGYEVEVRIPFKSLRYQSGATQDWGIQIIRTTQHTGYEDTWAPVVRASASFLIQSGTLKALTGLRRGLVMDVAPDHFPYCRSEADRQSGRHGGRVYRLGGRQRRDPSVASDSELAALATRPRRQLDSGTRLYGPYRRECLEPRVRSRRPRHLEEDLVFRGAVRKLMDKGRIGTGGSGGTALGCDTLRPYGLFVRQPCRARGHQSRFRGAQRLCESRQHRAGPVRHSFHVVWKARRDARERHHVHSGATRLALSRLLQARQYVRGKHQRAVALHAAWGLGRQRELPERPAAIRSTRLRRLPSRLGGDPDSLCRSPRPLQPLGREYRLQPAQPRTHPERP